MDVVSFVATAGNAVKYINDIRKIANSKEVNDVAIQLQDEILAIQQTSLSLSNETHKLTEKVRNLEKEIADRNTWDQEKENYELKVWRQLNIFAYVPKQKNNDDGKSVHLDYGLCPNCFDHIKSFLQISGFGMQAVASCPRCKAKYG